MNPARIGPLLDKVIKRMGLAPRLRQGLAVDLWPRVVGPEIARQTVAGPIKDRVMWVRTANPVLAHQLSLMEREILLRYRGLLGAQSLRSVHIRIGEVQVPPQTVPAKLVKTAELSAEVEERLSALAGEIHDQQLADSFLRFAKKWATARMTDERSRLEERREEAQEPVRNAE